MGIFSSDDMKKKIAILGSTGSIGKSLLDILKNDKKNFEIVLLAANKNLNELIKQVKLFNVKNIIISDYKTFLKAKKTFKNKKIKIFSNFSNLKIIFKNKKIDYIMSSITGLDGLVPTIKVIKFCKTIAIANKESIICAWDLIKKELKRNKTNFIPVDSEHFSIWSLLSNNNFSSIKKIHITASGGPFIKFNLKEFKKIKLKDALKHPNWSMGKKITIDSATMMNKVFEVIEARHMFNLHYKNISILTHPKSYVHAIVNFNNGLTKLLIHEPNMKIPIHNSIYHTSDKKILSKPINLKILNNLEFNKVNPKKFPLTKIISLLPEYNSLYETALVTINDYFVKKFLYNKINYLKMINLINYHIHTKSILKLREFSIKNIQDIYKIRNYVSLKLDKLGV